jgi:hypothetical protein
LIGRQSLKPESFEKTQCFRIGVMPFAKRWLCSEVCERLDSWGYGSDTGVQCHLDLEFMSLPMPDGENAFDINGDRFKSGISISNSEITPNPI